MSCEVVSRDEVDRVIFAPVFFVLPHLILFSDFTFTHIGSFPVDVSLIGVLLFLATALAGGAVRLNPRVLAWFLLLLTYLLLMTIFSDNPTETLKSISLFALALTFLISFGSSIGPAAKRGDILNLVKVFILCFVFHSVLVICQFLAMNFLDSFALQNPFGNFSPLGPMRELNDQRAPYIPYPEAIVKRPNGFFSEPSVSALYTTFAFSLVLCFRFLFPRWRMLILTGLGFGSLLTFSASGAANLFLLSLLFVYVKKSDRPFTILHGGLVLVVLLVGGVIFFTAGFADRLGEFTKIGSSGYLRVVAPFKLCVESILNYPFGYPLGDTSFIASRDYYVDWVGRRVLQIDNSFFVLIHFFGVFGLGAILVLFRFAFQLVLNQDPRALPVWAALLAAGQTGAVYSPQMALLVAFVFIAVRNEIRMSEPIGEPTKKH